MPEIEREPESNAGAVDGEEKPRQGATKEKPQPACDHPRADLADRHCRDCGSELHPVPVAGIERVIDERLRELGLIDRDGRPAHHSAPTAPADPEAEQFGLYQEKSVRKDRHIYLGSGPKFKTLEEWKAAKPEQRKAELKKFGVAVAEEPEPQRRWIS